MRFHDWSCGPDTLCQCTEAYRTASGEWDCAEGEFYGDVPAWRAEEEIARHVENGAKPIWGKGGAQGYRYDIENGDAVMYADCDECTYEEYYGRPYDG